MVEKEKIKGSKYSIFHNFKGTFCAAEVNGRCVDMPDLPKFVFECQKTGRCCYVRDPITIYLSDLERWWNDGTFGTVFPHLKLDIAGSLAPTEIKIEKTMLKKEEKRSDEEKFDAVCPLLNRETKECTIYSTRPISCSAFPLGYDGQHFILRDSDCPGINKGKMTAERLKELRDAAKSEYTSIKSTSATLPAIHSLLMKELTEFAMKEVAAQKEDTTTKSD